MQNPRKMLEKKLQLHFTTIFNEEVDHKLFKELNNLINHVLDNYDLDYYLFSRSFPATWELFTKLQKANEGFKFIRREDSKWLE